MPNKMLIDSTHAEETRVVVVRGNRVEEFDFETAQRKQIRGNIYLAKVTRVEPSLQAAFIEYGGNRHGFLAFSEIHPDYYQIPVADRQALIEADERAHREAEEDNENRHNNRGRKPRHRNSRRRGSSSRVQSAVVEDGAPQPFENHDEAAPGQDEHSDARHELHAGDHDTPHDDTHESGETPHAHDEALRETSHEAAPAEHVEHEAAPAAAAETAHDGSPAVDHHEDDAAHPDDHHDDGAQETMHAGGEGEATTELMGSQESDADSEGDEEDEEGEEAEEDVVESVGGDDVLEEVPERAFRPRRQYKIQEVIKRRQVMLVQVVKEERGNKGAALTTYLSLAGRYAVLMPNTARGGGISRKITSAQDRSRLKEVVSDLDVPEGMGIILRTAGAARTRPEIKRDFEYLIRMWETVRDTTLKSQAPTLVYEEGSLIKRSLRDLFSKEIDEIQVAGEAGYQEARDFMKMLMPTSTRAVKFYRDAQPLFAKMGVESQLDAMFQPTVQLKSGGYIVLNQTEALVSIDVNSGRSTREHNIEDTALKTNLEAAEEVARQLRLRDLAGLIVIDFIDMDEKRNNRAVERKMSDCLRHDRARIQVGRISHFGLLEMSRQRIRASVLESSTEPCPHCGGTGHVRSVSSVALQLLRAIEEMLMKGATHNLITRTRTDVALYVLNHKRGHLRDLENTFKVTLAVIADPTVSAQQSFVVDRGEQVHTPDEAKAILAAQIAATPPEEEQADDDMEFETEAEVETEETEGLVEEVASGDSEESEGEGRKRPRRRRRSGRGRSGEAHDDAPRTDENPAAMMTETSGVVDTEAVPGEQEASDDGADDAQPRGEGTENGERRPRRRGRRGGRRRRNAGDEPQTGEHETPDLTPGIPALTPADPNRYWNGPDNSSATQADAEKPSETQLAPAELKQPEPVAVAPDPVASTAVNEVSADAGERAAARRRSTVREKVSFGGSAQPAATPVPTTSEVAPQTAEASEAVTASPAPAAASEDAAPRKAGWWSRRFGNGE